MVPPAQIKRTASSLPGTCTSAVLRRQEKFTNGRDQPGQKRSLPETTVCRPTEGDQYRISGPSYVLAGTAILNSKTLHVITRPHSARGRPRAELG
jgi:hypothetical protein